MEKLLVICGPTATGKTSLALRLAKEFNGELVSADSRQVYKGMDIGTGKDLPKGSRFTVHDSRIGGFYEIGKVKIWGYDLVSPKAKSSVVRYIRKAELIIDNIWKEKKLPILVGGTGLYIKAVVDGIPTVSVPKNENLRKSLEEKPVRELFENLAQIDPIKAASMNFSDRKNPRRLIRAIEVAQWQLKRRPKTKKKKGKVEKDRSTLFIGLRASRRFLKQSIKQRVKARLDGGIEEEIQRLLKEGVGWEHQSMDSLGHKQWRDYFEGKKQKSRVIKEWERQEYKYAKRQMTWFKRNKRVNWFDIKKRGWQKKVEKLVKEWYKN
ncbi:MAG: tRNA (adenosine(37)-N6)-dimethylallyltransferase MiaA [Microgenomates group bacterium]